MIDLKDIGVLFAVATSLLTLAFYFGHLRGTVATKQELQDLETRIITANNAKNDFITQTLTQIQTTLIAIKMKLWPDKDPTKEP